MISAACVKATTDCGVPAGGNSNSRSARAARHFKIDAALIEPVAADKAAMHCQQGFVAHRHAHADRVERALQPLDMALPLQDAAANDRDDLIDPVAEQEAAIENGNHGPVLADKAAVDEDESSRSQA